MRHVKHSYEDEHEHECLGTSCRAAGAARFALGSWWKHSDPDCQYPVRYDCPICDTAPTDWAIDVEESD